MKLAVYYVLHTFKNQLKKLFKTWVLIFVLACMVVGGLIGYGAAALSEKAEERESLSQSEPVVEEEEPSFLQTYMEENGVDSRSLIELAAGLVILAVFVFEALSADKNGSKIFLPADVNLLFASPMQPQSVLMFRLTMQLGAALAASVYLLFQLPNLTVNLGLGLWAAIALILAWCLTIAVGKLLQTLLYTLCSSRPGLKSGLRRGVYLILLLIVAAFILYWRRSGEAPLKAAVLFFCGRTSRLIPLWGWLRGLCAYAAEGSVAGFVLCLLGTLAGGAVLLFVIRRVNADFYEDAMAKSEETAALLEKAQSRNASGLGIARTRQKDRSERLRRDGLDRGEGARMFFIKAMYNRFRFAHLGYFTKTTETYLVAAAAVALFCRFVLETRRPEPVALVLAAFAFFRALGNPLEQDTKTDLFRLIPESGYAKLFWSLLGGTVNCLLDVLPAMLLGVILLGANPLPALAWICLIVSVDFYATSVGVFIGLSVPVSAGKMIKQMAQILFIYFGLLPDIAIMAVGFVFDHVAAAAIGSAALNLGLGFLFFAFTPLFIDPKGGTRMESSERSAAELRGAKQNFSQLGLGAFVILLLSVILQNLFLLLLNRLWPAWPDHDWTMWIYTFVPMYLIAVPVGLLIMRKAPRTAVEKRDFRFGGYAICFFVSIFLMYAGNFVGIGASSLVSSLIHVNAENPLLSYVGSGSIWLQILFMVILAPLIEEYIFRKQLIDRMNVYGGKLAVFTSALMFGLFHGNLYQLFYAFALGLVFGYLYLKSGQLRWSVGLHMFINFLGSVVGPTLVERSNFDALSQLDLTAAGDLSALEALITPGTVGLLLYAMLMVCFAIAGLVLLCVNARKVRFAPAALELPKGTRARTAYGNAGMILLIIACVLMILLSAAVL